MHSPTLLIHKEKACRNIDRMMQKVADSKASFRPHFKTHQSHTVGQWFREKGIQKITVSSVDMAIYFAQDGWQDILIAFPVNPMEVSRIMALAEKINLHVILDSMQALYLLQNSLSADVCLTIWLDIDAGYHRTGILWSQTAECLTLILAIRQNPHLKFGGILTHAGDTYHGKNPQEILVIFNDTMERMHTLKKTLESELSGSVPISIGDTPGCTLAPSLAGANEVRAGNFVYNDLKQVSVGVCTIADTATAMACSVVGIYPHRNELIIHGGAVHFSKDFYSENGQSIYGKVLQASIQNSEWEQTIPDTWISSLSQEHGTIKTTPDFLSQTRLGDVLLIAPVHSCLTVSAMKDHHQIMEGSRS